MKILFTGGGTAGHVTPALAIAEGFTDKHPKVKIAFIGRCGGSENELITKSGYELFMLNVRGLSRSLSLSNFKVLTDAMKAKREAKKILSDFKPDMVIGTGGYVCWPVICAAQSQGIKTALHESNASAGLTTKLLAKKCDIILLGAKTTRIKYKNAVWTGNPLRKNFTKISKSEAKRQLGISNSQKMILSVGGSIGAKRLNDACISVMEEYSTKEKDICHMHISGKRYYDEINSKSPALCKGHAGCRIIPFSEDMAKMISAADLIISRCGAMTLAEIAFCEVPSILIPSPNVTGNHQLKNARYAESHGSAITIEEKELSADVLLSNVKLILNNSDISRKMQKNAKKLASGNPREKIVEILEKELLTR